MPVVWWRNERELRQREADAARRHAFTHDDIQCKVLHRRVEDFLHGVTEAMHFVDKENVVGADV